MCIFCKCVAENDYEILKNKKNIRCCSELKVIDIPDTTGCWKRSLLSKLESLDCENCVNLEEIPENLSSLSYLNCRNCKNLRLPKNLPSLEVLICDGCTKIPSHFPKLETLILSESLLDSIDFTNFSNLRTLLCEKFTNITEIKTSVSKLEFLYCNGCTNLEKLPEELPDIRELYCNYCVKLQKIKCYPKMVWLNCEGCISLQEIIGSPEILFCDNCPFLNHSENPDYSKNIRNLSILQNFCRKYLKYRRFVKYVNSKAFIEWIYDPERIGGRLSKKSIEILFR